MGIFRKHIFIFLAAISLTTLTFGQADNALDHQGALSEIQDSITSLDKLAEMLGNGKATFAFFYYSVACSCTAVQCSLAFDAIDKIDELKADNESLNYISIDAFHEAAAESLYQCQVVPLIVGYNKEGKEVMRADWDINDEVVNKVLSKIEE